MKATTLQKIKAYQDMLYVQALRSDDMDRLEALNKTIGASMVLDIIMKNEGITEEEETPKGQIQFKF